MAAAAAAAGNTMGYTRAARVLHWTMAILIVLAYVLILSRKEIPRGTPLRTFVVQAHFWVGIVIFLLAFPRLVERLRHRPPPIAPPLDRFSWALATLTHLALYLFLFVQPMLGVATLAFDDASIPVPLTDLKLPLPVEPNEQTAEQLENLHKTLGAVFYWIIGLHVLAALFHRVVRRDNVLQRMWRGTTAR
ncbi:cytochrome b [soil metagenome]